ncbi:MAG: RES family NAD+ phosphorylase [Brevundimonas sp.]|uniref:RES family NAD+ phosphorylase n=1 Tax=Brevundimonas sp. TaxID=1871086 RepID=UPI00256A44CE|nr:RES family NAD+ phosphorylase [Brevundimonas sp.]MDK2747258.1 RES family NAD+ phosphorylase [Brevundimonas sp.]
MSAPRPPADFASRTLPLITLDGGVETHRFHNAAFGPTYYDKSDAGRLNAPAGEYGVLYVAEKIDGAFAESFLRTPGATLLAQSFIDAKAYARLAWTRPLKLAQMYGQGLALLGATAEITHGSTPYDASYEWSKAVHDHPEQPDGIAYRSRHDDDQLCYAVFDRAASDGVEAHRDAALDADWFYELMLGYRVHLSPV